MIKEFRKNHSFSRIFPKKDFWKIRTWVFFLLFFISGNAQSQSEEFPEILKSFIQEFQKHPSESTVQSFRTKYPSFKTVNCSFEESERFEKVVYLSYKCKEKQWAGFIYLGGGSEFWKDPSAKISFGEILKIGKKVYLEVKPFDEERFEKKTFVNNRLPSKTHSHPKEYKDNHGLQYFLSIAKHPAKRNLNSGKEIFFDSTCPLIFLKKDSDFYWEKAIYYSFQASCIPSSPYSYIRIRSDFLGKIRLDDKDTDQIQEGAKYIGKLKIQSIEADKILWHQEAEIYNE
ncbi:LIC11113 family protein [Leptospira kirschneri]|uniref:Uncharacterized protein n=1 Tax=Leptospira kirschneri str. 200802841 TaxID=1193047 RepID=A0A828Y7N3_9LEPT|nr:hypothetical protein [Leptospira kirschneri]EJO68737.1 hypothetical protein LEP1GSC044_2979 [Leptospira kirschneri serovar Grippotyphosa str. RM52]EKO51416.1 hypothetical protein LEP1GSC131_1965 [Leptospira kirschneri str. 200802841]EKP06531.1 hypothetical protein LEP1GSC018_2356 [Leptospira kirschneri str. 2008720114]EKQ82736.1 hypothetical protein LEP1GSC064_1888 [Leptospira kirschneri serovar Grippotyphosa str. Moskva]EKR07356.1 hypothetical protein LEP1GSC122_2524 [Leptospira kirschneri